MHVAARGEEHRRRSQAGQSDKPDEKNAGKNVVGQAR